MALSAGLPHTGLLHFKTNAGHSKNVTTVLKGPPTCFFSGGQDGNFYAWQLCADGAV